LKTVWHISSNRWNSAITEYVLSSALASQSLFERVVLSPLAYSPAEKRARAAGFEVMSLDKFRLSEWHRLRRLRDKITPDAVFLYGGPETSMSALMSWPEHCQIFRFRGQNFVNNSLFRLQQRLSLRHISCLLAPSESLKTKLTGTSNKPVFCVPLGIDNSKFRLDEQALTLAKPERPELVIFGRLDPVKGHARFMKIFSLMLKNEWSANQPRPLLHIAGRSEGLGQVELERVASSIGINIESDVKFTIGDIPNVAALLRRASLGVVSSVGSEEICRVAQEFLMCGTPVLVSGVGALQEVLCFPRAGYSYLGMEDVQASQYLAQVLKEVLAESEQTRGHRQRCALEVFSIDSMAHRLKALIV